MARAAVDDRFHGGDQRWFRYRFARVYYAHRQGKALCDSRYIAGPIDFCERDRHCE